MSRNRDIPEEAERHNTRGAWVGLLLVVLLLVWFLVVRPVRLAQEGAAAAGMSGIVESQGQLPNKYAPGGSWQWLKVRLVDGRVVDAVTAQPPLLREGDRVVIRPAARGPFPHEAVIEDVSR